jgi:hypothetical protein
LFNKPELYLDATLDEMSKLGTLLQLRDNFCVKLAEELEADH